ncbi:MAG: DNA-3-methyladenine glycosylase I [Rhodospirillales bacterium]|nr:DNA-3-methyladenine glycosylase I [Rhodospirillales bacterium]
MSGYCAYCEGNPVHGPYHDREHGFPARDTRVLFERLILEINQAGLSWDLMLKKRESFRKAYAAFEPAKVARFGARDVKRLLADAGIVRNRLKVAAAIHNAGVILDLERAHGSFAHWIDANHPRTKPDWVKLFRKTFKFTGGEIVGEFLMSLGYLPGAHRADCATAGRIARLDPPWMRAAKAGFKY